MTVVVVVHDPLFILYGLEERVRSISGISSRSKLMSLDIAQTLSTVCSTVNDHSFLVLLQ